ncbi:MAG: EVE domain-containing protein, partial [Syntrophomonadaceae bacterium]|nr:EVE domain-containing protein [Syntrophomonadaceae bacterium]
MAYWLLKTEPDEYSWDDLVSEKETIWDGVKAPLAIKNIKEMKLEDLAFIYHTGKERAVIGIAKITSHPYYEQYKEWRFRVMPLKKLPYPVTLKKIKEEGRFPDWDLVKLPRLSVIPVN